MSSGLVPKERMPWRHLLLFGWMPGFLKLWCYRTFLGYRIGHGVRVGPGAAIVADDVDIGDHVSIGFFTIIRGRSVRIGAHTRIGATTYLLCRRIEIGEDAKINEQVFLGGPQTPASLFRLGSRTIVMQLSFLNATEPLIIGDDSGIGGHCLLFTHGSWLNVLDGYPVTFAPITIGKSVWLPWRVFVMPGANIGDGSVIGANSLVQGDIPASSLAVGAPAKVIRSAPDFPRRPQPADRRRLIMEILESFDRYVEDEGITRDGRAYAAGGHSFHLIVRLEPGQLPETMNSGTTVLTDVACTTEEMAVLRRRDASWLDLSARTRCRAGNALCEELAQYLSRYGIRLARIG